MPSFAPLRLFSRSAPRTMMLQREGKLLNTKDFIAQNESFPIWTHLFDISSRNLLEAKWEKSTKLTPTIR